MKWCTVLAVTQTTEHVAGANVLDVTGVVGMSLVADDHPFGLQADGLHLEGQIQLKDGALVDASQPAAGDPPGGVEDGEAEAVPGVSAADRAVDPPGPGQEPGPGAAPGAL